MDLTRLRKAKAKLDKAEEDFRIAHSSLSEDRHKYAGLIYHATKELKAEVSALLAQDGEGGLL